MKTIKTPEQYYDFIIIGSGFGGSVSALRLTEKGYKVLVIEKGKYYSPDKFPETNWNLRKWLWLPSLRFFGIFKMTFFRHVGVLSGVGVGGGSLVYANTLPRPPRGFYTSGEWAGLEDWEKVLEPFYSTAEKMLGASINPNLYDSDLTLKELAAKVGKEDLFEPTRVSVFFGEPEIIVSDPYFNGEGPEREGCSFCGGCMTGCRHNAKNSLDKNYLYLAERKGAHILPEHHVKRIVPLDPKDSSKGYRILIKRTALLFMPGRKHITSKGVVIAGGVLGTVRLLLDMKRKWLPGLSDRTGDFIRTNNESLVLVDSRLEGKDFSKGIAIGSIFPPDENSHIEPVRYGKGSNFWKLLALPQIHGRNIYSRTAKLIIHLFSHPVSWLHVYFTKDFSRRSVILLYMQHLNSTLRFKRGLFNLRSNMSVGEAPSAFMHESKLLAEKVAEIIEGKPFVLVTEAVSGIPTTAHILGGAVIGRSKEDGVIDVNHRVFGYENLFICDGSAVSSNPGVNPSLTITAMTERAMSMIPEKK
jgi:cholesterol oxidase